jgi:hypothetical protein
MKKTAPVSSVCRIDDAKRAMPYGTQNFSRTIAAVDVALTGSGDGVLWMFEKTMDRSVPSVNFLDFT